MHYRQNRDTGECSVDGCGSRVIARSWCSKHYQRWKNHGDPLVDGRPKPRFCKEDGCDAKYLARGFCWTHYYQNFRDEHRVRWRERYYRDVERSRRLQRARAQRHYMRDLDSSRAKSSARKRRARALNPKLHRDQARTRYARHSDRHRLYSATRRARIKGAPVNDFTVAQWCEIKAAYRHRCAYCGKRRFLTMDHVVPLAKGGSHTASNIVPACFPCNNRKKIGPAPEHQPLLF